MTLAVVNDAPVEFALKLAWAGPPPSRRFFRYRYTEAERDRADVKVNPQPEFSPAAGSPAWPDVLPPNSLTIYSTYQLNHDDAGILVDAAANGND